MRSSLCTTDGILDISTCKKGAPIVLSSPHFYNGDLSLFQQVYGLKPEKRFHETFLEIEPVSMFICRVKESGDSSFSCHPFTPDHGIGSQCSEEDTNQR